MLYFRARYLSSALIKPTLTSEHIAYIATAYNGVKLLDIPVYILNAFLKLICKH